MTEAAKLDRVDSPNQDSAAGDSVTVAAWTLISRATGVIRVAVIGAVLGPTVFGNAYQFTNSLPNLIYYGFFAGSLFSSLLVPALVSHVDRGDRRASERVAGGFLGTTLLALVVSVPIALIFAPMILRLATLGGDLQHLGAAQMNVGRWLIVMFAPQIFLYGVVGTATAAMNAKRRFALAAAAPALENLGIIAVLGACAVIYGTNTGVVDVPRSELILLGLGTTGAVAMHASAQWWGARRAGITLLPRRGWRDPEVRVVVRRALPSLAQAGLVALQMLTLLVIANRVPGGVVAFQIALNFYFLAIALGATPVALASLPRLSRMHIDGDRRAFHDTLVQGYGLGFFVTIPAAVAYVVLAVPIAHALSFGRMNTPTAIAMVAGSLVALAAAVIGQTVFLIATYAFYARKDTRSPLKSMGLQAGTCLCLAGIALFAHGPAVVITLGVAFSVSIVLAAGNLAVRLRKHLGATSEHLGSSVVKILIGSAAMAGPAWLTATVILRAVDRPLGAAVAILAAALVGGSVFVTVQAMLHTRELALLGSGFAQLRRRARTLLGVSNA